MPLFLPFPFQGACNYVSVMIKEKTSAGGGHGGKTQCVILRLADKHWGKIGRIMLAIHRLFINLFIN